MNKSKRRYDLEEKMHKLKTPAGVEKWLLKFKKYEKFSYNPYWTFKPFTKSGELKMISKHLNIYRFRNVLLKLEIHDNSAASDCDITHIWIIIDINVLKDIAIKVCDTIRSIED